METSNEPGKAGAVVMKWYCRVLVQTGVSAPRAASYELPRQGCPQARGWPRAAEAADAEVVVMEYMTYMTYAAG